MKIKFYTYVDRRPDFIELQYQSLKHFMKNDFELIIINNCSFYNYHRKKEIDSECKRLGLNCIRAGRINHINPAIACATPIQWSFHKIIKHDDGISCIIDSDMFLVNYLDMEDYMKGFDIAAVKQIRGHVNYLWNGLMFFNLKSLPNKDSMNFMCGKVEKEKVDVGGHLYHWIKQNPQLKIKNIPHTSHIYSGNNNLKCLPDNISKLYEDNFRFEIYNRFFLHYGRGSNWDKMDKSYHERKTNLLKLFVLGAIEDKIKLPDYTDNTNDDCWNLK